MCVYMCICMHNIQMYYSNVQDVNGPIFLHFIFFVFVGSLTKMSLGLATVIHLDWEGEMRKREPGFLTRRGEEKYITVPFLSQIHFLYCGKAKIDHREICGFFLPFREIKSPRKIWKGLIRGCAQPRNFVPANISPRKVLTSQ